jgi:N-acetyl-gamma-glutamylphosphate reductase
LSFWDFGACRAEETHLIRVGVVGGTGHTGVELLRLLAAHPDVQNMNLMFGFPETQVLERPALFP